MNGGIRWVSLNEREKAVNERGGKEDKRREKHSRMHFFDLGESIIFIGEDCIAGLGVGVACWWRVLLVFA